MGKYDDDVSFFFLVVVGIVYTHLFLNKTKYPELKIFELFFWEWFSFSLFFSVFL